MGRGASDAVPVEIAGPAAERVGPTSRVHTVVDGHELWFESEDAELKPAPEAIGAALLVASASQGRPLLFADPVDPRWAGNARKLLRTVHGWWGYPEIVPIAGEASDVRGGNGRSDDRTTGLCFTAGVDSFFSLVARRPPPALLVMAIGYDVPLDDHPRVADLERRVRTIADVHGLRAVVVRTNLRQVPLFANAPWGHTHGGALAALGHLLCDTIGTLVISSSYTTSSDLGWGSHWRIDHRSSSSRVRCAHFGERSTRFEKIRRLIDEPMARAHLQVCFKLATPTGNCGRCPKCVNTMVLLSAAGGLDGFVTLTPPSSLAALVDRVGEPKFGPSYRDALRSGALEPEVAVAVRGLLERMPPFPPPRTTRRHLADLLRLP